MGCETTEETVDNMYCLQSLYRTESVTAGQVRKRRGTDAHTEARPLPLVYA